MERADKQFEALSEEDQMLHLLCGSLTGVREVYRDFESRLKAARSFIAGHYGPKFADRVLGTPELLAKLRLEPMEKEIHSNTVATTRTIS